MVSEVEELICSRSFVKVGVCTLVISRTQKTESVEDETRQNSLQICQECCLHPYDAQLWNEHTRWCFSKQQTCGKCKKVIWETKLQQFAILPCRHPFCLTCIAEEWPAAESAKPIDFVSNFPYTFQIADLDLHPP